MGNLVSTGKNNVSVKIMKDKLIKLFGKNSIVGRGKNFNN